MVAGVLLLASAGYRMRRACRVRSPRNMAAEYKRFLSRALFERDGPCGSRDIQRHLSGFAPPGARMADTWNLFRSEPRRLLCERPRSISFSYHSIRADEAHAPGFHAAGADPRPLYRGESRNFAREYGA